MIKKLLLKSMVVITGLLLHFNLWAQTPPITLHVETAGTLSSMTVANRKYEITDLTLTGNLDSRDIRFIREMAGCSYAGIEALIGYVALLEKTDGKLANLNLTGASIVKYRESLYRTYINDSEDKTCYFRQRVSEGYSYRYNYFHTSDNDISSYMFSGCTSLKSIILPKNSTSIGHCAFLGCTNLTNITIPENVMLIQSAAFYECINLTGINIPNDVTSIGYEAFYGCNNLKSIDIPNNVTSIGYSAFKGCVSLTDISIPNNVTSIQREVFYGCSGLTSITIPNSVTSIEDNAFYGCTGLTSFITSEENTKYSTIDGVLFNKEKTILIQYPKAKATIYSIPNNVTSIGNSAFYGCTGLTSITIPNSVISIGNYAFRNCTELKEIHSKNSIPPNINSSCFQNVNKTTCKLYVPKGSYTLYWLASGWSEFNNIIEEENASAINTIKRDNITIQPVSNGIFIEIKGQTSVSVYNLSGQMVYQSVINGNVEVPLNKGIYILRVNNESEKVIVK